MNDFRSQKGRKIIRSVEKRARKKEGEQRETEVEEKKLAQNIPAKGIFWFPLILFPLSFIFIFMSLSLSLRKLFVFDYYFVMKRITTWLSWRWKGLLYSLHLLSLKNLNSSWLMTWEINLVRVGYTHTLLVTLFKSRFNSRNRTESQAESHISFVFWLHKKRSRENSWGLFRVFIMQSGCSSFFKRNSLPTPGHVLLYKWDPEGDTTRMNKDVCSTQEEEKENINMYMLQCVSVIDVHWSKINVRERISSCHM